MKSLLMLFIFAGLSLGSVQAEMPYPHLKDLKKLDQDLKGKQIPLALIFVAKWCPYCKSLEDQVLIPMKRGGEYKNKVMIRMVPYDEPHQRIIDWNGKKIFVKKLNERHQIEVTPTIVFLGAGGKSWAEPIYGYGQEEFFWYDFDKKIAPN